MVGKARVLFLCILLLMAGGCASKPVFTVEVYETATPFQAADGLFTATPGSQSAPSVTESPALVSTALPEFTPADTVLPADFSPILYGEKYDANTFFFLLGGVQAGRWLTPEQAAAYLKGTAEYDIYTSAGGKFQILGYAPESTPIHPGQTFIGTDTTVDENGMVGVAHGWTVRLGQAEELSADIGVYRQVVLDWLKSEGLTDPQLGILHIYRIDLEADGVDEIFITASHLDDSQHTTSPGDYSIVLMRKVVGNEAVTLPLIADIYRSKDAVITYPSIYSLSKFIDLNQDGTLEVVVDFQQWEGNGALIYAITGQEITKIP